MGSQSLTILQVTAGKSHFRAYMGLTCRFPQLATMHWVISQSGLFHLMWLSSPVGSVGHHNRRKIKRYLRVSKGGTRKMVKDLAGKPLRSG